MPLSADNVSLVAHGHFFEAQQVVQLVVANDGIDCEHQGIEYVSSLLSVLRHVTTMHLDLLQRPSTSR